MRLSDRIIVLKAGRIVQEGSAEALYDAPADLFIARLFAEVAEIRGVVRSGTVETPFGRVPAKGLAEGAEAIVCVRQRSIDIGAAGTGTAAKVIGRRFLGEWVALHVAVAGLDEPISIRVAGEGAPETGIEIGLNVDAATVSIFPGEERNSK